VALVLDEVDQHVEAARNGGAADVRSSTIEIYRLVGEANFARE
jgi:hypothetical protein